MNFRARIKPFEASLTSSDFKTITIQHIEKDNVGYFEVAMGGHIVEGFLFEESTEPLKVGQVREMSQLKSFKVDMTAPHPKIILKGFTYEKPSL